MAKNINVILNLNFDFKLLKDQKLTIIYWLDELEKQDKVANKVKIDLLNGMLSLIDEIQEQSTSKNGIPPRVLFATERYASNWEKKQNWLKKK